MKTFTVVLCSTHFNAHVGKSADQSEQTIGGGGLEETVFETEAEERTLSIRA